MSTPTPAEGAGVAPQTQDNERVAVHIAAVAPPAPAPAKREEARPGPETLPWTPQGMVQWFSPSQLAATGMRAVLSAVFGSYADRREVQAALHDADKDAAPGTAEGRIFRYDQEPVADDGFWVDYVADLGDGFRSTYTVGWLLGQPTLPAPPQGRDAEVAREDARRNTASEIAAGSRTRRGRVLVMGGDQVYPTASREEYTNRLAGPYEAALPWVTGEEPPHLFAIPGNHDWYDGLTAFIRQFCQQRWIGGWKTLQPRSYWALRLPNRWWLLGVDVQLQSDIDQPQLEYFCQVAKEMRPGDRVILCTAEPAWVHTGREEGAFDNLAFFESKVLGPAGAELALTLTGDLHHYARYSDAVRPGEEKRHKITAGGGGAYLLGTQLLPEEISLAAPHVETGPQQTGESAHAGKERWLRGPLYPDCAKSWRLKVFGVGSLFFKNPTFTLFMGCLYALFAWFLDSASKTSATFLWVKDAATGRPRPWRLGDPDETLDSFMQLAREMPFDWGGVKGMLLAFTQVIATAPSVLALNLLLVAGMIAFCAPDVERSKLLLRSEKLQTAMRVVVGAVHGTAHVALIVLLTWLFAKQPLLGTLERGGGVGAILGFVVGMAVIGGLAGAVLMSLFLLPFVNYNEAFSAQHLETFRNFVRLKIGRDGRVTVFPYGVDSPGEWKFRPVAPAGEPYFDAVKNPRVRLIDGPFTLSAPRTPAGAPTQGA